jgi:hypothetical protein
LGAHSSLNIQWQRGTSKCVSIRKLGPLASISGASLWSDSSLYTNHQNYDFKIPLVGSISQYLKLGIGNVPILIGCGFNQNLIDFTAGDIAHHGFLDFFLPKDRFNSSKLTWKKRNP